MGVRLDQTLKLHLKLSKAEVGEMLALSSDAETLLVLFKRYRKYWLIVRLLRTAVAVFSVFGYGNSSTVYAINKI